MQLPFEDRQTAERYKDRYYGKYRGFVRDNNDPERRGRVRMEVPAVLGQGKDNWSDWGDACLPFGGAEDAGCFVIPMEGTPVWVEFEGGDTRFPIWVGFWYGGSDPGKQPTEATRVCDEPTCQDCEDKRDHAEGPDAAEHLKYAGHQHPPFYCPRRSVLFKSETGHTILVDDKDGKELLEIIDRAGQVIRMLCPVKPETQVDGQNRRADRRADEGTQVEQDDLVERGAGMEFMDVCRQVLRFEAWKDEEKVILRSCDATEARWQQILIDTTKERERIEITGLNGQQRIVIDNTLGAERIEVTDKAGSTVLLDAVAGNVVVRAANMVIIN